MTLGRKNAMNQYGSVATVSETGYASQHRLVQMLMEGVLDKMSIAKGQMLRKDYEGKGKQITTAMSIIAALKGSLDLDLGGEIALNLDDLYAYITGRLIDANVENSVEAIDEVSSLITQIKVAWDSMPDNVKSPSKTAQNN